MTICWMGLAAGAESSLGQSGEPAMMKVHSCDTDGNYLLMPVTREFMGFSMSGCEPILFLIISVLCAGGADDSAVAKAF